MSEKTFLAVCPDILLEPHLQFNVAFCKFIASQLGGLTVFACPSFIIIQNLLSTDFSFQHTKNSLYDITLDLDNQAKSSQFAQMLKEHCLISCISDLFDANEYVEIANSIASADIDLLESYQHKGCPVGLAAGIDLSLTLKATYSHISNKPVAEFARLTIFHNIIAIEATERILKKSGEHSSSTQVFQNSVYSQNLSISNYLLNLNISQFFIEPSPLFRSEVKIYRNQVQDQVTRRLLMASGFEYADCSSCYTFAKNYLELRIARSATHSYSPVVAKFLFMSIADVFPESSGKKRYVYYTNSPDELHAIEYCMQLLGLEEYLPYNKAPFLSEYENIKCFLDFARSDQDHFFFIRMHPRLGSDKRGLGQSYCRNEYLDYILALSPPSNVRIILPEDNIPSYWLGCWCHGVLSFRGTMPLEMNLLGYQPLVGSSDLGTINSSINIHAVESRRTSDEWYDKLKHLDRSSSISQLNSFIRDFAYSRKLGCIDLDKAAASPKEKKQLIRSVLSHSSLDFLPYRLPGSQLHALSLSVDYILWVQEFVLKHIVRNQTAPIFSILDRLLIECHEMLHPRAG